MNSEGLESGKHITLRQAFGIRHGEVISVVGGGGKTTLMFALAHELASNSGVVITTTTTKILEPLPSQTPLLLIEVDEEEMIRLLLQNVNNKYKHITLASQRLASGKLKGISRELVSRLAGLKQVNCIIVEADGAAHRSLKAPNLTEPVIPANTSLVIPVVGIDAAGCRLTEESVFRSEVVSKLLGLPIGEIISVESIAILLTHRQGIIKGSPNQARIVPFINKVELDKDRRKAMKLADIILAKGHPQIKAVVLGRAQSPEPVIEVINAG